jgi:hypothetical protein
MNVRLISLRAAAVTAVFGALALAGCGGGGSKSMLPIPANGATTPSQNVPTMTTANGSSVPMGTLSVTLPNHTSAQAQSSGRVAIFSAARQPAFIDTTTQNSSLVVSVTPQDPSEASQFGNLTLCYNLYTNGLLVAQAPPNFIYTNAGNNVTTVTIAVPAPPGTDGFQITQYSGQCGSSIFTLPTPPPGNLGASNILAQTPVTEAYMAPGVVNQLNQQIFNCTPAPAAGQPCPLTTANNGTSTFAASVTVASVVFGTVPITNPVREQGGFIALNHLIGIPIPLEAKDASGAVIPGLTTFGAPLGGAGFFPSGVTVTDGDASAHTQLYVIDATTGAVAQGPAKTVKIHEFNVLNSNTIPGFTNICDAGAASCSDTLVGGTAGDPYIIMLTSDGVDASLLSTVTVTAAATVANAALPAPITTTISPQSAVYTAGGAGYADASAPTAPLSLLQPVAAGSVYYTDGNKVKIDGTGTASAATGTTLTGLAYAAGPAKLYAVDNGVAGGNVAPSGLYAFDPATLAATPVVTQNGNGVAVQFKAPVASVYAADTSGNSKLFVVDGNGIEIVDITQATQTASNVGPLLCSTSLAAPPAGVKLFGTIPVGTANSTFLVADPGNSRIAQVTVSSNYNCTISTYATGAAFTGLVSAGGTALYATSTTGQIYYISGSGATAVSLGVATAAAGSTADADGPIGQLSALGAAPTGSLTPVAYLTQFVAKSFFDTVGPTTGLAAPYTLAPFNGTKAVSAVPAPIAGFADTSSPSGVGAINATGGIILVPAGTAAAATVTPDSLLFVDSAGTASAKLRTLVR